jgi:hypothetical protein
MNAECTNPIALQINGNKTWRNCEKVDKTVAVQEEPDFVGGGNETDEKIDEEENVESLKGENIREEDIFCLN